MESWIFKLLNVALLTSAVSAACLGGGNEKTINSALAAAGANGVVRLCQSSIFTINNAVTFTADGQELSTEGYPTSTTRATIQIDPSNAQLVTAVQGINRNNIKLLNVIVEGSRPSTWTPPSGTNGLVEVGGTSTGTKVSGSWIRNTRSWACLRLAGGSTTYPYGCTKMEVSNNVVGPCGNRQAPGSIANGITGSCARSVISNNQIKDFTASGLIVFGSPESTYSGNILTSPANIRAYVGIQTSGGYNGNFSGVSVRNNQVTGGQMINIGLAIGAGASGGFQTSDANYYSGPAQFTGNSFSGNIAFSVGAAGWKNGLTVTGTSTATKPNSKFADAVVGQPSYDCTDDYVTWKIFYENIPLWYYSKDLRNSYSFGSNFKDITFGRPSNSFCMLPAIASSASFAAGSLAASAGQRISFLHEGVALQYQSDNSLVVVSYANPDTSTVLYDSRTGGRSCGTSSTNQCRLNFTSRGQIINTYGGSTVFESPGPNPSCVFQTLNQAPWFAVRYGSATGPVIWSSTNIPR